LEKIVLTSHMLLSGDGGDDGRRRRRSRPNPYDIHYNQDLYPNHARLLQNRYKHVRERLFKRVGVQAGIGTYLKLTEMCGRSFAELIRRDENFRWAPNRDYHLGYKRNPKYLMRAKVWGEEIFLIYDAYDMMVLTVFADSDENFQDSFNIHPDTVETQIIIDMDKLYPRTGNG